MRIIVDYRPALRARSGVGEYVHQACRALAAGYPDSDLTLFTSSWKDRPSPSLAEDCPGAHVSDHRLPVRVLNFMWHNLEWPPVDLLTRKHYDVAFSPHPLLLPVQNARQVVMIHDLDFLRAPHRTTREIRRDYPRYAKAHAQRAACVIVPSQHTADEVVATLRVRQDRVVVCPPGAPHWATTAAQSIPRTGEYVLFVGTLEPRKNLGGLLRAYATLRTLCADVPKLVIVGKATPDAEPWLQLAQAPALAGHVQYLGYVADADRRDLYAGARVLVLPSFDEGFGMPALEAMSLGVPVIASRRGALPDLVGDAGILIDPDDRDSIVAALRCVLVDDDLARDLGERGRLRARHFHWKRTADALYGAFSMALQAGGGTLTAPGSNKSGGESQTGN